MRRREFIAGVAGAAAWPVVVRAQQAAVPVIGVLGFGTPETEGEMSSAFQRGLADMGYVEGRNIAVEYQWAGYHADLIPVLVAELVRRRVALIFVSSTAAALAAKASTKSIPIVFSIGADPVEVGLVASLNQPGGNITGTYNLNIGVAAKRLELVHEAVPAAISFGYLANPASAVVAAAESREVQAAARTLGIELLTVNAENPNAFEAAFAMLARERAGAVLISSDSMFSDAGDRLVALAEHHRIPAMHTYREATAAGGLMSYGTDRRGARRQSATYIGRILKGEKPSDLPVRQVTKIDLVINLKTAKALGLTIPETLLATADEVIQ
jgi:putative tryptophan/tyrosine transport system substrate-binding protein